MPRLLTYNVHRCVGTDKKLDVERVAAVIAEYEPDIVCLQELDVGRLRTKHVDQAEAIATHLKMGSRFYPAMKIEAELYGDAILTPHPERLVRADNLPSVSGIPGLEPRGAIWSEITIDGVKLNVINTHLGLVPREQRLQALALTGSGWLGACEGPTLLAGDFNATSITRPYQILTSHMQDSQRQLGLKTSVKTFPSAFPAIRIDHCFITPHIRITGAKSANSPRAKVASDHLPLIIDFEIVA